VAFAPSDGPVVAVGQGADELFYGYAHSQGLSPASARDRAQRDWSILEGQEWPRAQRMARGYGLELRSPFVDPDVVRIARCLDPPGPGDLPKIALRRAAEELGLPGPLVRAPKRAMQYGSGIHRLAARHLGAPGSGATRPDGPSLV
jgi:asparagine synthetase B (glutamine-hydrolysing)